MRLFLSILLLLVWHGVAWAVPECYEKAAVPAHEFPFQDSANITEVTALSRNGQQCHTIAFWRGVPVIEQEMYVPFRQAYISYAKALDTNNIPALKNIYTYLRPTPRTFDQWVALFGVEEGALMPWGMPMAIDIVKLLQPNKSIAEKFTIQSKNSPPMLNMQIAWPVLYLLMGGEMYPDDKKATSAVSVDIVGECLKSYFPLYTVFGKYAGNDLWRLELQ